MALFCFSPTWVETLRRQQRLSSSPLSPALQHSSARGWGGHGGQGQLHGGSLGHFSRAGLAELQFLAELGVELLHSFPTLQGENQGWGTGQSHSILATTPSVPSPCGFNTNQHRGGSHKVIRPQLGTLGKQSSCSIQ